MCAAEEGHAAYFEIHDPLREVKARSSIAVFGSPHCLPKTLMPQLKGRSAGHFHVRKMYEEYSEILISQLSSCAEHDSALRVPIRKYLLCLRVNSNSIYSEPCSPRLSPSLHGNIRVDLDC